MASSTSKEAYQCLMEMIGRAFYDNIGFEQRRSGASGHHNHGILVVILEYFGRHQCWKSVFEVARDLDLSKSQVQEAVSFLEEEKMLIREPEQGTQAYCYGFNYAQIYKVITYKLLKMKEKLETEHTIAGYFCPNCDKRYTALDAATLVSGDGESFLCENCKTELESEGKRLGGGHEKFRELQLKMEEQMKPLMQQLERVKNLPAPEFDNPWRTKRARDSP